MADHQISNSAAIRRAPPDDERTHEIVHLLFTRRLWLTTKRVAGELGEPDGHVECVVNGCLRTKVIRQRTNKTRDETPTYDIVLQRIGCRDVRMHRDKRRLDASRSGVACFEEFGEVFYGVTCRCRGSHTTALTQEGDGFVHPPIERGGQRVRRVRKGETYAFITASRGMQLLCPATQMSGSLKPRTGESPGIPEASDVPRNIVPTN